MPVVITWNSVIAASQRLLRCDFNVSLNGKKETHVRVHGYKRFFFSSRHTSRPTAETQGAEVEGGEHH